MCAGDWVRGLMHGQGTLVNARGDRYEGGWSEHKLHGKGAWTFPNGVRFVSEWRDGKVAARGKLVTVGVAAAGEDAGAKWDGRVVDMPAPLASNQQGMYTDRHEMAHVVRAADGGTLASVPSSAAGGRVAVHFPPPKGDPRAGLNDWDAVSASSRGSDESEMSSSHDREGSGSGGGKPHAMIPGAAVPRGELVEAALESVLRNGDKSEADAACRASRAFLVQLDSLRKARSLKGHLRKPANGTKGVAAVEEGEGSVRQLLEEYNKVKRGAMERESSKGLKKVQGAADSPGGIYLETVSGAAGASEGKTRARAGTGKEDEVMGGLNEEDIVGFLVHDLEDVQHRERGERARVEEEVKKKGEEETVEMLMSKLKDVVGNMRDELSAGEGAVITKIKSSMALAGGWGEGLDADVDFVYMWLRAILNNGGAKEEKIEEKEQMKREWERREAERGKFAQLEAEAAEQRELLRSRREALERIKAEAIIAAAEHASLIKKQMERRAESAALKEKQKQLHHEVQQQRLAAMHAEAEAIAVEHNMMRKAKENQRIRAQMVREIVASDTPRREQRVLTPDEVVDELARAFGSRWDAFVRTFRLRNGSRDIRTIESVMVRAAVFDCEVEFSAPQVAVLLSLADAHNRGLCDLQAALSLARENMGLDPWEKKEEEEGTASQKHESVGGPDDDDDDDEDQDQDQGDARAHEGDGHLESHEGTLDMDAVLEDKEGDEGQGEGDTAEGAEGGLDGDDVAGDVGVRVIAEPQEALLERDEVTVPPGDEPLERHEPGGPTDIFPSGMQGGITQELAPSLSQQQTPFKGGLPDVSDVSVEAREASHERTRQESCESLRDSTLQVSMRQDGEDWTEESIIAKEGDSPRLRGESLQVDEEEVASSSFGAAGLSPLAPTSSEGAVSGSFGTREAPFFSSVPSVQLSESFSVRDGPSFASPRKGLSPESSESRGAAAGRCSSSSAEAGWAGTGKLLDPDDAFLDQSGLSQVVEHSSDTAPGLDQREHAEQPTRRQGVLGSGTLRGEVAAHGIDAQDRKGDTTQSPVSKVQAHDGPKSATLTKECALPMPMSPSEGQAPLREAVKEAAPALVSGVPSEESLLGDEAEDDTLRTRSNATGSQSSSADSMAELQQLLNEDRAVVVIQARVRGMQARAKHPVVQKRAAKPQQQSPAASTPEVPAPSPAPRPRRTLKPLPPVVPMEDRQEAAMSLITEKTGQPSSAWHVTWSDVSVGDRVGVGNFAEVFKGVHKGATVAVKKFLVQDMTAKDLNAFCSEASFLLKLRHPNVCHLVGVCAEKGHFAIITEFLSLGNLHLVLKHRSKTINWPTRVRMGTDVAEGLAFLHSHNPPVLHLDVKSPNLLVDEHMRVKLADFGLAMYKPEEGAKRKEAFQPGTVHWMAPELIKEGFKTTATDIFALGVVLWELWAMKTPYAGLKVNDIARLVREGGRPELQSMLSPSVEDNTLYDALMREAWHEEADRRPSALRIVERLTLISNTL